MMVTPLVDAASLAGMMSAPLVLLDCRFDLKTPEAGRTAYLVAHLPGAFYMDLRDDLAGPVTARSGRHPLPSTDLLGRRCRSLGIVGDIPVVVYDQTNGSFAARAWWLLRWLGHSRVAVLDGGFDAWVAGGGSLESGTPPGVGSLPGGTAADPAAIAKTRSMPVAGIDDVRDALRDPARCLIDARAAERFAGTVEPIDPVAGHVPGAVNHPFTANLRPDGRFLDAAKLRRRWSARLGAVEPAGAIVMCGSGVTACHHLLALEVAGLPGARLYPGSWSEWIRDPARPVARD